MKRVNGVDLARGVGLIGVFVSHLTPDILSVLHGRSMALLVLVSGISLTLVRNSAQTKTLMRMSLVFVLGYALMLLHTPFVVILPYLALTIVAGVFFLNWKPKILAILSIFLMIALPLISHFLRFTFKIHSGEEYALPDILDLVFSGYYPVCVLLPTFLLGLALGKLGLSIQNLVNRVFPLAVVLLLTGYGGSYLLLRSEAIQIKLEEAFANSATRVEETAYRGAETIDQFVNLQDGVLPPDHLVWQAVASPHTGTPFDIMGSTGAGLIVLISCLLVATSKSFVQTIFLPIVYLGSVSLSAYVLQVLISSQMNRVLPEPQLVYLGLFVGTLLLAAWFWRRKFQRGPLESLLHWFSERAAADSPH